SDLLSTNVPLTTTPVAALLNPAETSNPCASTIFANRSICGATFVPAKFGAWPPAIKAGLLSMSLGFTNITIFGADESAVTVNTHVFEATTGELLATTQA